MDTIVPIRQISTISWTFLIRKEETPRESQRVSKAAILVLLFTARKVK
jgi:hypothetical protein